MIVYVALYSAIIFLLTRRYAYDDPYITYRYAQNLSQGLGLVYNPGERILSTTTPFFALFLSIPALLKFDIPQAAALVSIVCLPVGGLLIADIAHNWKTPVVGWTGLLLYPSFPLLTASVGSEIAVFLAFCLGAFSSYNRKNYPLAALLSALATLTRPDGILVAILLSAHYLITKKKSIPWISIAIYILITLAWFLFVWGYYGSPLPMTLIAKQSQAKMPVTQDFLTGIVPLIQSSGHTWLGLFIFGLCLLGVLYAGLRAHAWVLFLSWSVLQYLTYSILRVPNHFWYYALLAPGFICAIGLGLAAITQSGAATPGRTKHIHQWKAAAPGILSWTILGLLCILQFELLIHQRDNYDNRYPIYRAAGQWLGENTPEPSMVATLEAGIIGFYSNRQMVDFAGLLQPQTSHQFSTGTTYQDAALWAVRQYHPQYLVLHSNVFPQLEQETTGKDCQRVKHFSGGDYGYAGSLDIYECHF